jgi:penicillin-binding protein 1A
MTEATPPAAEPSGFSYKLKRDVDGFVGRWQGWWQHKRFRLATYAFAALLFFLLLFWALLRATCPMQRH